MYILRFYIVYGTVPGTVPVYGYNYVRRLNQLNTNHNHDRAERVAQSRSLAQECA